MLKPNNVAHISGRAGAEPELRTVGKTQVASFFVATSDVRKNSKGKYDEYTEWHKIEVWGKMAEIVAKKITKGMPVQLIGKIETSKGATFKKADGTDFTPYYTSIRAESVNWDSFYEPKSKSEEE